MKPSPPGRLECERKAPYWDQPHNAPVAILGSGPAGLFAAFILAANGIACTVFERGSELKPRARRLAQFHRRRELDPECNLLFGEGGAGTYSDGKIYTRVDDPLELPLLLELVRCGAPPAIAYDSLAHIGTDRLHKILPVMRAGLEARGVQFLFDTRIDDLVLAADAKGQRVVAVRTPRGDFPCSALLVACGHSARDTWSLLASRGVVFQSKPFQLGLRIEHPQELIDSGRFGGPVPELGAASYNLLARGGADQPAVYTFCMCPGGRIVASVNEAGLLCTNGMSNSKHSSSFATSAIVTTLSAREFGPGPFDGVSYQRQLEAQFFAAGGGDWTAPAQAADDFLAGRVSASLARTTWPFGCVPARLDRLLPAWIVAQIARGLATFERQLPGFCGPSGVLVGLESRSSGPVRLPRDKHTRAALGFSNLYPLGEGAGYAGGIMSAALDGANCAKLLAQTGPVG